MLPSNSHRRTSRKIKKKQIYNEKRQIARSIKTNIEQKWKSDAVDR